MQYFKRCVICVELFASSRSDAKTCGPRCRKVLSRTTETTWLIDKEFWLYRILDKEDKLLYVGATTDPHHRLLDHSLYQPWWKDVSTITWQKMPDKFSALQLETKIILDNSPQYNIRIK